MKLTKQEKTAAEFEMAYEKNEIALRGIVFFAIGLFLLIAITFVLMFAFLNVLEQNAVESKKSDNPMLLGEKERLPAEPRLQLAPGFAVDGPNARKNLELMAPQSEYRELLRQWDEIRKNGQIDSKSGTVISLPIEKAKEILLEQNIKARSEADAESVLNSSRSYITDASAGRMAAGKRR